MATNKQAAAYAQRIAGLEAENAALKVALKLAREPLELRAEYDPTYPPESKPINDCAKALAAIDALTN